MEGEVEDGFHESRLAVRVGFEPTIGFPLYTLSKRAPSTTRPPHRSDAGSRSCHARRHRRPTQVHASRGGRFTSRHAKRKLARFQAVLIDPRLLHSGSL